MRPITSLKLSRSVISSLIKEGFLTCDDMIDKNGDILKLALEILKIHGYENAIIKQTTIPNPSSTALDLLKAEGECDTILTFSEALDNLLGGGVPLGSVIQVCGAPGSGKTQLMLQLCVNVQIPAVFGGLEGEAVFIDTERSFTFSRLAEMAEGAQKQCHEVAYSHDINEQIEGFNLDHIFKGVHYLAINNYTELLATLQYLCYFIAANPKVKIVVVDSLVFPFLGVTKTLDRTRLLCKVISQLQELATKYSIAVAVVNDLTTRISKSKKLLHPAMGESLTHKIQQTLLLGKVSCLHTAVLLKCNKMPEDVVNFHVQTDGIRDSNAIS